MTGLASAKHSNRAAIPPIICGCSWGWLFIEEGAFERGPQTICFEFIISHSLGPIRWDDRADVTVNAFDGHVEAFKLWSGSALDYQWQGSGIYFPVTMIDSDQALELVEAQGGAAIRKRFPEVRVRLEATGARDSIDWDIDYILPPPPPDVHAPHEAVTFGFSVDAQTGQVRRGSPDLIDLLLHGAL